jgi:hypothetical protein
MKKLSIIMSFAAILGFGGAAFAEEAAKLSEAECLTIWNKADAAGAGSVDTSQSQAYVADFASVDANGDGKLTQIEFQDGCAKGLVQASAASGAGAGTEGSDSAPPPASPQ